MIRNRATCHKPGFAQAWLGISPKVTGGNFFNSYTNQIIILISFFQAP